MMRSSHQLVCPGAPNAFLPCLPVYRACLPLLRTALAYVARAIRRHRAAIGLCWRKCNPGQQALLVSVQLRKGGTLADLAAGYGVGAAGYGVGTATAWRCVREAVASLPPERRSCLPRWPRRRRPGARS